MYCQHTEYRSRAIQDLLETAWLNICCFRSCCLKPAIYWPVSTQSNYCIRNSICSELYHRSARRKGGYPSKSTANHRKVRIHYQHHDSPLMKSFLHPQYGKLSYTCFSIFVAHSRVRVNCITCSK